MYIFKEQDKLELAINKNNKIINMITLIRLLLIVLAVIFFICYFTMTNIIYLILGIVIIIIFIINLPITNKYYIEKRYLTLQEEAYKKHEYRKNGNNNYFLDKGLEFKKIFSKTSLRDKYLLEDIDVFGKNSLFSILSSAHSVLGRYNLALSLCHGSDLNPKSIEEVGKSEDLVKLEASLALNKIDVELDKDSYINNLASKFSPKKNLHFGLIGLYIIDIIIIILSCLNIIPIFSLIIPFVLNLYYATLFKDNINSLATTSLANSISETRNVLKYLNKLDLTKINNKYDDIYLKKAIKDIKKLINLWQVLSYKNNLLFKIIFNGLICFEGLYQLIFNKLQLKEERIKEILTDISDLELICSYANLVCDYNYSIGEISENLEFSDLSNILVKECVPNSFNYEKGAIITGSNMSGKTTFLRTIAEAVLLFNACKITPSKAFKAPKFMLYTALRIKDDLASGISSFYAEIEKIKEMIEDNTSNKKLCLIDEIFKGTNTLDRIYGAKMLIKKLEELNYDFIISTHDFELCEVDSIINYHFSETYLNEYKEITFDYKLKEGKSVSTNAIFLLKKSGIIN